MKTIYFTVFLLCLVNYTEGQNLASRTLFEWNKAGIDTTVEIGNTILNIKDYGAVADDSIDDQPAFIAALQSCNYQNATILIPEGTFLLKNQIVLNTQCTNLAFKGVSSKSIVNIDLTLRNADGFIVIGSPKGDSIPVKERAALGQKYLLVKDASGFEVKQNLHISLNDDTLIRSAWAHRCIGMINEITSINNDTLFLKYKLSLELPISRQPQIQAFNAVSNIGFECMTINRLDQTPNQTCNILFRWAKNCWVKNIESNLTNFAHIGISFSRNLYITQNYMHHSHQYSEGGNGYGISTDWSSSLNLIENNIFSDLRHALMVQAGANSNVYSYNFITKPSNMFYGDIAMHGNYPFGNLFEGNTSTSIIADNSHFMNGTNNVFLRNKTTGLGILSELNVMDSSLFIGNHVFGNGLIAGSYRISGRGTAEYGNMQNGGFAANNDSFTTLISLYLSQKPAFMLTTESWPIIGNNFTENENIPAQNRFSASNFTECSDTKVDIRDELLNAAQYSRVLFFDRTGKLIKESSDFSYDDLNTGLNIIQTYEGNIIRTFKVFKN